MHAHSCTLYNNILIVVLFVHRYIWDIPRQRNQNKLWLSHWLVRKELHWTHLRLALQHWLWWYLYTKLQQNFLQRIIYKQTKIPQYSPHEHHFFNYNKYGQHQLATTPDTSPLLSKAETKRVQFIVGTLLYYACAIDNTLLPALNDIAIYQTTPTKKIKGKCQLLLDYVTTYPNMTLCYHKSNMHLHTDSDAAYLVAPK